jgi:hypothetical protein
MANIFFIECLDLDSLDYRQMRFGEWASGCTRKKPVLTASKPCG